MQVPKHPSTLRGSAVLQRKVINLKIVQQYQLTLFRFSLILEHSWGFPDSCQKKQTSLWSVRSFVLARVSRNLSSVFIITSQLDLRVLRWSHYQPNTFTFYKCTFSTRPNEKVVSTTPMILVTKISTLSDLAQNGVPFRRQCAPRRAAGGGSGSTEAGTHIISRGKSDPMSAIFTIWARGVKALQCAQWRQRSIGGCWVLWPRLGAKESLIAFLLTTRGSAT